MKSIFAVLQFIIRIISFLLFAAGIVFTVLGGFDIVHAFTHLPESKFVTKTIGLGLLQAVDLFLIAIVLFVFSLGILELFNTHGEQALFNLPKWLRVENFMQLKVILWEAILTTFVISYLAGLARLKMEGGALTVENVLFIPGAILLIALSLYLLKRGESHATGKSQKMD